MTDYYVGFSENIEKRLADHNQGRALILQNAFHVLVYTETFETALEVRRKELQIKKMKSRKYIESFLK